MIKGDFARSYLDNSVELSKDGKVMAVPIKGLWQSKLGKVRVYNRVGSGRVQKGSPLNLILNQKKVYSNIYI